MSDNPPPKQTRAARKVALLFRVPLITMIVLSITALGLWRRSYTIMEAGRMEMVSRQAAANAIKVKADAKTSEEFQSGEITADQTRARNTRAGEEWGAAMADASKVWMDSMPPIWLQIFAVCTICGLLPVLLLLLLFRSVLGIAARRLGEDLHRKGYAWLGHADLMWLLLTLRTDVRRIPSAADFHSVPGFQETTESLVEFVRLRKTFKNQKPDRPS